MKVAAAAAAVAAAAAAAAAARPTISVSPARGGLLYTWLSACFCSEESAASCFKEVTPTSMLELETPPDQPHGFQNRAILSGFWECS